MLNLLKAEFAKLKNEKLLFYSLLIITVLSLLLTFGYAGLELVIENQPIEDIPFIGFNGKAIFLGSFSPTQNIGILIPIILCIILTREFTYGTIRNKVICGHKKMNIYLSVSISSLLVGLILFLFNIVFNLLFSSLILGYGTTFTIKEFLFILKSIGIGLLVYSTIIAFTVFIAMNVRSLGISLLVVIIMILFLGVISALDQIPGAPDILIDFVSFLPHYQLLNIVKMDGKLLLKSIILSIFYISLFTSLGFMIFKKRDLK